MPSVHLRGGGVSVVLDTTGDRLPRIVHWGADVGEDLADLAAAATPPVARAAPDVRVSLSLLPERSAGHRGRPGLTGDFEPALRVTGIEADGRAAAVDATGDGLALRSELRLSDSGLLELRHALRNEGERAYRLDGLACVLPLPEVATEVLDLTGRWCRERSPQRRRLGHGTWLREGRHGRTGHDATLILAAGTPDFGFRSGEVWAVHLGWSGNHATYAERNADGVAVLGAAELLEPGEVVLQPGETYATPWLYSAYSQSGLDGISAAFHGWLRARPSHPARPRPVVLNTWEAVYFDHRLDRLTTLADTAARLGVERFVLDDGWFGARRDDTAGLGDWTVSTDSFAPLADHVRGLGMEFGVWVEPEMVNPDSDLYRAHPDWVLGTQLPFRNQLVLDLSIPGAHAHVRDQLAALLEAYDIAYLKWDHNRDFAGRAHAQTLRAYALLDELRERFPALEIESCSSGGARADLGILARTDRVWASDTNDALERQPIQRWTSLLLPPELIGTHVGPPRAHTTGRTHDLSFRLATALFGHFGIEWDISEAAQEEQAGLAEAIELYKRSRALLHSGTVVRADHPDPAAYVYGVVAPEGALFAYVQLDASAAEIPGRARLPGLEPDRRYRVEPVRLAGGPAVQQSQPPGWYEGGVTLTGRALATAGLQMPILQPEQALLLRLT
jgi:alpha-galactosidase